ncbi:MAG TPA: polymer-forming cytoskeletal protein [Candidatus Omnitrophota bacterium]|nr:polymer-forming cytoskeletal protein [Candidatus Omnitrophota bacterium]
MISLCLIATMGTLSIALLQTSVGEMRSAERFEQRLTAFHLADGAIDDAIVALRANRAYAGAASTPEGSGTYRSVVSQVAGTSNTYTIQTMGSYGTSAADPAYVEQRISAVVNFTLESPFKYATFSTGETKLSGQAEIDSFDSTKGFFMDLPDRGSEGDIGSNSTDYGAVTLRENTYVHGSALLRETEDLDLPHGPVLENGVETLFEPEDFQAKDPPAGLSNSGAFSYTAHDGGPAWEVSGLEVTTPQFFGGNPWDAPGAQDYLFNSIKISGNNHIVISTVPATLYVDGNVRIDSGQLNPAGFIHGAAPQSADLVIIVKSGDVTITGDSWIVGAIYAPNSRVKIDGQATVFGAVIAKELDISGGAKIHYDTSLKDAAVKCGTPKAELVAWQEDGSFVMGGALTDDNSEGYGDYYGGDYYYGNPDETGDPGYYGDGYYGGPDETGDPYYGDYSYGWEPEPEPGPGYDDYSYGWEPEPEPAPEPSYDYYGYYGTPPPPAPAPPPTNYYGYYGMN